MPEIKLTRECMVQATKMGFRLFRNNVGKAWIGESFVAMGGEIVRLNKGDVIVRRARRFHAGLAEGSADLIGIRDGQFVSVETKWGRGRLSAAQIAWQAMVEKMGGLAVNVKDLCGFIDAFTR